MATKPFFGTVVHLTATGHVLAVVASGALEPTVEQLTGSDRIRVRFAGLSTFVNVPVGVLTATRLPIPADLLDRPQWYVLNPANSPPLTFGSEPKVNVPVTPGVAGKKVIVVWQSAGASFPEDGVLDAQGKPPSGAPTGATAQLVAYEGGPLYLRTLP